MIRLTSRDRGALRRIQATAERLGPGQPYEIAIHPDRPPHVLSHGALARGRTLLDLPPLFGVSGYLDARALLHGDADGWQAERVGDGPRGLRTWARGDDWAEILRLDLADGEILEIGQAPSAHARAALARALAPLGTDPLAAPGGLAARIRDVGAGRLHGLRFQRHGTLRLVVVADTPRSGWRPVALLEDGPPDSGL